MSEEMISMRNHYDVYVFLARGKEEGHVYCTFHVRVDVVSSIVW